MSDNFRSGYLAQGAPLGALTRTYNLTADDQVVQTDGVGLIQLYSDSATASARTITLISSPLVGHQLTLTMVSGSSFTCQLVNTGNMKLAADWTPTQNQTLSLISDGTNWIERGRSYSALNSLTSAHLYVGSSAGVATDTAVTGDVTIGNTGVTAIGAGKVLLAMLGTGIKPSHFVKFAGNYTTTGGNATEAQTLSGVASTDIVLATLKAKGGTPRTLLTTAPTTDTITYVFSGDPSTDHVVAYQVLRAAS